MGLKYKPSSEPLHIYVKKLFSNLSLGGHACLLVMVATEGLITCCHDYRRARNLLGQGVPGPSLVACEIDKQIDGYRWMDR